MSDDTTIVIASAARTPVGSFNGSLGTVPAHELGKVAIQAALQGLQTMQRADGSMVSKPLEDLWPYLDRDEFRANMIIEPLGE